MLPDRARSLLQELDEFAAGASMHRFRAEAETRFVPAGTSLEPEDQVSFLDYVTFTHRDGDGSSCLDRFLAAHGASLSPEARQAVERFRGSIFGIFRVEAVDPGRGLRLRLCGGDAAYDVIESSASRGLRAGMGLMARLVPFRDHHELTGDVRLIQPEVVYLTERLARERGDEARAVLADPVQQRALIRQLERQAARPKNRVEAELHAEAVLAQYQLPLKVADLQQRFQRMESLMPIFSEIQHGAYESKGDLQRVMDALVALWNHTPRPELGGHTPEEAQRAAMAHGAPELPKHLAADLMRTVSERLSPEDYADKEEFRRTTAELQRRWLDQPQEELGGLSPREWQDRPFPPLPEESALPAPDRPAWASSQLASLLDSRSDRLVSWALEWIAEHPRFPAPPDFMARVSSVLDRCIAAAEAAAGAEPYADGEDEEDEGDASPADRLAAVFQKLALFRDHPLRVEVSRLLAACLPRLRAGASSVLSDALDALADLDLPGNVAEFLDALQLRGEDGEVFAVAAEALGSGRVPAAVPALLRIVRDSGSTPHELGKAFAALFQIGDEPAIRQAVTALLASEKREGGFISEAVQELDFAADLVADFDVAAAALFPPKEGQGAWEATLGPFVRQASAAAERRAHEVLPADFVAGFLCRLRAGPSLELARLLAERTMQALKLARDDNPHFARQAGAMAAVTESVLAFLKDGRLRAEGRKDLITLQAAFLYGAIRGHDPGREVEAAATDAGVAVKLCWIDTLWQKPDLLLRLAPALGEEQLLGIIREAPGDSFVRKNAWALLAAIDPLRHLATAATELAAEWEYRPAVTRAAARRCGDAILGPYCASPPGDREDARETLGELLAALGSERGRCVLEAAIEPLAQTCHDVDELLQTAMACGSRASAQAVVDLLKSGDSPFDPDESLEFGWELEETLETAFALFELEGLPGEVLGAIVVQQEERERGVRDSLWGEEPRDEEDDASGEGDVDETPQPIRRSEPKVSRNAKCPCGSGRKYKNCCGKQGT